MLCLFSQPWLTGKIPCIIFCDKGQKILWGTIFPKTKSKSICGTKASCKVNEESGNYIAALLLYCSSPQAKKTKKNKKKTAYIICLQGVSVTRNSFWRLETIACTQYYSGNLWPNSKLLEGKLLTFWKEVKISSTHPLIYGVTHRQLIIVRSILGSYASSGVCKLSIPIQNYICIYTYMELSKWH